MGGAFCIKPHFIRGSRMDNRKIKNLLTALFALSFLLVNVLWFVPLSQKDSGGILVLSDSRSFARDVLLTARSSGGSAFFEGTENAEEALKHSTAAVVDARQNLSLEKLLNGYENDVVIVNPNEDVSLPDLKGRVLITAEAGGALKNDKNAVKLYNSLTGLSIEPNGRPVHSQKGNISLKITPGPVIMLGSLSGDSLTAIGSFLGGGNREIYYALPAIRLLVSLIELAAFLGLIWLTALEHTEPLEFPEGIVDAKIKNTPLFFLSRLVLILASVFVSLAVFFLLGLFDSLKEGGILFLSYIIGCSFTTKLFYRFGMMGIKGKPTDIKIPFTSKNLAKTAVLTLLALACGLSLAQSGFWAFEINSSKLFLWAVVFVLLFYGFISVMQDLYLLQKAVSSQILLGILLLFPYIPLVLIAAVYVPLGEFYMTMSVLKLMVFTFICLLLSKAVKDRTGSVICSSISGALCLSSAICFQSYI